MSDLSAAQVIAAKFLELEADPMNDPGSDENLADEIASIALAALAAAGYAVVKLPDTDEEADGKAVFWEVLADRNDPGGMWLSDGWVTTAEGRNLAASLLAGERYLAAQAAEAGR